MVAPDLRGYGRSDRPTGRGNYTLDYLASDINQVLAFWFALRVVQPAPAQLITQLGHEKAAAVVGHDWGGAVAWHFAERFPLRLDKLVILNAPNPALFLGYWLKSSTQKLRSLYMAFFQVLSNCPWVRPRKISFRFRIWSS